MPVPARHGVAGPGRVRLGKARRGFSPLCLVRLVTARRGQAWLGKTPHGIARPGVAPLYWSRLGAIRRGGAGFGEARLGMVRLPSPWLDRARPVESRLWRGLAGLGKTRPGKAPLNQSRQCDAGRGKTGPGLAVRGEAWRRSPSLGLASLGQACHPPGPAGRGVAGYGPARLRLGRPGLGAAWRGRARRDKAPLT